jgi:hypothetical protein
VNRRDAESAEEIENNHGDTESAETTGSPLEFKAVLLLLRLRGGRGRRAMTLLSVRSRPIFSVLSVSPCL